MEKARKKTIFSGVQPSGVLHIGNYLGAISQWVPMQDEYDSIFCVVDYHAITVKQNPEKLNRQILDTTKVYLASGINPEKSVIFQQSRISAHTELAWILNTITPMGELARMTQFKEKTHKFNKNLIEKLNKKIREGEGVTNVEAAGLVLARLSVANVGLFDYPVLMAADILLYNTDAVPVGEDQVQHVELARTLARRFNAQFSDVFKVPEVVIRKEGARIMGLDDPTKKMSKSATSGANYISLLDDIDAAKKKIARAVTDSGREIKYDAKEKPAISNLLTIFSLLSDAPVKELEKRYKDKGYGAFKKDLAEAVADFLNLFQKKFRSFSDGDVREILNAGAKKARPMAEETLGRVKEKLGIV